MKNRIYFFANFGDWSKIPFGGGEVGNRRTLALLKKLNYDIVLIPKYIRVNDHSLINSIELLFKIISNIFLFAKIFLYTIFYILSLRLLGSKIFEDCLEFVKSKMLC